MALYPKLIHDALATVRYPGTGKNLVEAEMVEDDLRIDGQKVSFSLIFEKPTDPFMKSILKSAEAAIKLAAGADAFLTGEIKHHEALYAMQRGICVIEAGHFETENPVISSLANRLRCEFSDIDITIIPQKSPVKYIY